MTPAEAADFLNHDVAWEPGLKVQAVVSAAPGQVGVLFTRTVQDSTVILPDGTYPEPGPARNVVMPPAEPLSLFELRAMDADRFLNLALPQHCAPPVKLVAVSMMRVYQEHDFRTREELLYQVIRAIGEMHLHDIREFTRVRDASSPSGWKAPFHPHRPDGKDLWRTGGHPAGHAQ